MKAIPHVIDLARSPPEGWEGMRQYQDWCDKSDLEIEFQGRRVQYLLDVLNSYSRANEKLSKTSKLCQEAIDAGSLYRQLLKERKLIEDTQKEWLEKSVIYMSKYYTLIQQASFIQDKRRYDEHEAARRVPETFDERLESARAMLDSFKVADPEGSRQAAFPTDGVSDQKNLVADKLSNPKDRPAGEGPDQENINVELKAYPSMASRKRKRDEMDESDTEGADKRPAKRFRELEEELKLWQVRNRAMIVILLKVVCVMGLQLLP